MIIDNYHCKWFYTTCRDWNNFPPGASEVVRSNLFLLSNNLFWTEQISIIGISIYSWLPQPEVSEIPWLFRDKCKISLTKWINKFIYQTWWWSQPSPHSHPLNLFMLSASHVQCISRFYVAFGSTGCTGPAGGLAWFMPQVIMFSARVKNV